MNEKQPNTFLGESLEPEEDRPIVCPDCKEEPRYCMCDIDEDTTRESFNRRVRRNYD
jgi:hypothetical protein